MGNSSSACSDFVQVRSCPLDLQSFRLQTLSVRVPQLLWVASQVRGGQRSDARYYSQKLSIYSNFVENRQIIELFNAKLVIQRLCIVKKPELIPHGTIKKPSIAASRNGSDTSHPSIQASPSIHPIWRRRQSTDASFPAPYNKRPIQCFTLWCLSPVWLCQTYYPYITAILKPYYSHISGSTSHIIAIL